MRKIRSIWVSDNMHLILSYAQKRLQKNANMDKPPAFLKTTRILAEECIVDGDVIIFRIPNSSAMSIRKRLKNS